MIEELQILEEKNPLVSRSSFYGSSYYVFYTVLGLDTQWP